VHYNFAVNVDVVLTTSLFRPNNLLLDKSNSFLLLAS